MRLAPPKAIHLPWKIWDSLYRTSGFIYFVHRCVNYLDTSAVDKHVDKRQSWRASAYLNIT